MKQFDEWNEVKKRIDNKTKISIPKEREIYWTCIGENVGFEQNGKSKLFARPVLVLKRFNKHIFFGIPLSTQIKNGSFFFTFTLNDTLSNALFSSGKAF